MTLIEARRILKRHRGSFRELAEALDVNEVAISNVLRGKSTSNRIAEAAKSKALKLMRLKQ
jgi:transcriptional regulator with XRE-family HTH domain